MNVLEVIKTRRSIRHFKPEPVSLEVVKSILEAACAAPSAHNSQPWQFVVLQGEKKARLGNIFASLSRQKEYSLFTGFYVNRLLKRAARMVEEAPVVVTVWNTAFFSRNTARFFKDDQSRRELKVMEIQSIAAAIENLLLAAHGLGLGAVWLGVPLLVPQESVKKLCGTEGELMAVVPLGYPAKARAVPKKVNLTKKVKFID